MFEKLLSILTGRPPASPAIVDALWHSTLTDLPLLSALSAAQQQQLRGLCTQFLAEKRFSGGDGLVPTEAMALRVAMLACRPVLNLGYDWLTPIREVVLYPEQFMVQHEEEDEFGIVHQRHEPLSGETWEHGTLVLAWPEVLEAGQLVEGYNVVIHEIAHVLDNRNGAFNGFPPLPSHMNARQWTADFSAAFAELNRQLDAGIEPAIDGYAATDPTEFFAVTSEYHFERPDLLQAAFPAVAQLLAQFYDQAPFKV